MQTIDAVNRDLAGLDDGKTIRFLNINDGLPRDRTASIPERHHARPAAPGAAGYQLWADAMQPLLDAMMK
jgi:hypothetical protein